MKHPHHLLIISLLILLYLLSFPLEAKVPTSKIDLLPLLSFKSLISEDPLEIVSSWNDSVHYCQWQGVKCDRRHPERVTALVLHSKQLSGYISPSLANLTYLHRIDLADNQLHGSIPTQLGYLGRLRFFNLSRNLIQDSIPSTLGNCSKLEVISLANNNLHGIIPPNLAQCKELTIIELGNNFLTESIPLEFGVIPNLYRLGLYGNNLTGTIPSTLGNLSSLIYLYLHQNNFHGCIPDSLGKATNLQRLFLYENNFSGSIPLTLGNLTKLLILYLADNNLSSHVPSTISNLTNLLDLQIFGNKLSGTIPSILGNLNNIQTIALDHNRLSGPIPGILGKLQHLQYFSISFNEISGEIPHSFYNMSGIIELELGSNQLEGTLPFDMCDALPNLKNLHLYFNKLKGPIPPSISNCSALNDVELDANHFSGIIPSTLGILKNFQYFTLSGNQLEAKRPNDWSFINALANCTSLQALDIAENQFQGVFPSSVTNFTSLNKFSISYNPIRGAMPTKFSKVTNLTDLLLDHMLLSGTISEEIGNLFRLGWLDLSNNMISGQIPSTIGNLTQMTKLVLNNNAFEGSIPSELVNMQRLEKLDLSNNKLIGKIPKEIMGLTSLSIDLDLSHNSLTDILPSEIGNLINLQSISLSSNRLFGELPSTIGGCQELQSLYLNDNLFQGTIPSALSNLRGLQKLDISNNFFSGQVPEFISRMNLQYLNISFNNFEGDLPREGIFKNISAVDVRGNPKLCGGIPEMHLPPCKSESPTQSHHFLRNIVLISCVVGSFVCVIIVIWFLVTNYCRKKPHDNQPYDETMKYELKHVSYNDLFRATENFSIANLIGRGTYGSVYKAIMSFENMTIAAVKVLNLEIHGASRSFFSECEALRNVRHRNLIKVLSSCSGIDHKGNDFKALVFEFMSNGSLEAWLHHNIDCQFRYLSLIQRLNIAIDVASALDYLHNHGAAPIVHCDLKPSNVLLDDNMTAHVGDFGLAKFLIRPDSILSQSMTSTSGIKGSIGYVPPEYGMGGQPSVEGDVYSYGILILEMFTGVSPTDERISDGLSLHKQIEMAFPKQVMDMADNTMFSENIEDNNLYAYENVYDCLALVIKCGLMCSNESPKERISIKDVVKELNSARKKFLRQ